MKNKLGLTDYHFDDVEKKLVNFKLNLLNDTYTFNTELFSISYLIRLHNFLFKDIMEEEYCGFRAFNKDELDYFSELLLELKGLISIYPKDINRILSVLERLWHYQLFVVGNTRTIVAYLKIINEKYMLNIPLDINKEIKSNYNMFELDYLNSKVNQKTLTKKQ